MSVKTAALPDRTAVAPAPQLPRAALVDAVLNPVALRQAVAVMDAWGLNAEAVIYLRKAWAAEGDQQHGNQKESQKGQHECDNGRRGRAGDQVLFAFPRSKAG
ncbi:hypothetical protein [Ruegeria lacuscaerulensis]|uniref:hypothetical protein n=1 Tax=Ruegeria lacuscaerulensis TaxID=55218 RepID=UPI00147ABF27|nr:hypothetical protein [Ruegeria lacuscaerulensis]